MAHLDYTITDPKERVILVQQILDELEEEPSPAYLEILSNYIIYCDGCFP